MFYEKRDFFRLPVDIPAKILDVPENPVDKPKFHRGIIRDISGGGIKVESVAEISKTNNLKVSFSLPFNERDLTTQEFFISGEIIRCSSCKKDLFEYGLKFVNISLNVQDRIIKYLFDLQIASKAKDKVK